MPTGILFPAVIAIMDALVRVAHVVLHLHVTLLVRVVVYMHVVWLAKARWPFPPTLILSGMLPVQFSEHLLKGHFVPFDASI
jgi:hypothetical protein